MIAAIYACGVVFERWVTPEDADGDLIRRAVLSYAPMAPTLETPMEAKRWRSRQR
jgi:hypothetical protein